MAAQRGVKKDAHAYLGPRPAELLAQTLDQPVVEWPGTKSAR